MPTDRERLNDFLQKASSLGGLTESQVESLTEALGESVMREMASNQQLSVLVYDAKPYDRQTLSARNDTRVEAERCDFHFMEASLDETTGVAAAGHRAICIFVNDRCGRDVVETLASVGVELIALRCAGFNNVDLKACKEHGISVVRVPAYSPHAVAEHTVALMLMLNRHLHQAYNRNRSGYFRLDGLTGFDMHGQTVGVIGTGKIGQVLIDILLGFGCKILAYDVDIDEATAAKSGVKYAALERVLAESKIISLHVPLMEQTHHMIDAEAISSMQDGVMLINTSRGGLVDASALIDGLKSGKIGSAGLDVYEEEAGIFFHDVSDRVLTDDVLARLMTFNNVVVTSHMAFLTNEALTNIADTTLDSLAEFASGKRADELTNAVSSS